MEPHDDYAIGSADRIGVITATGSIRPIEYDLSQVQDEGFVRYNASLFGKWQGYETDDVPPGKSIPLFIAADVRDEVVGEVQGWEVPEYMLGSFLSEMDEPVYRQL